MNPDTRAAIAYIVARLVSGNSNSRVYDYARRKSISIDGTVRENSVSVYDFSRRTYVSGSATSLFDYGESAYISVKVKGTGFNGYDYGAQCYFAGNTDGVGVALFDYGEQEWFNYSL